ncbi:uncharacterized protein PgNI_00769 [Pyricularia grisea]|uniref:Uncharacterized protein n=1 Tax=Pyricularia grisea TaxID=148305 RepID=A0A6P8BJX6_PYRGI|nr:uncharacterized protein PgNI_00769 [Pyricularia grisea]TLD16882.1 hypothetical protein PgNI_00769 [Pyricularia grisea]
MPGEELPRMASRPQNRIAAAYYRGGTSRAIIFNQKDLPTDKAAWGPIFLGSIGSPDPVHGRQLDGMGGGISSLSKACVIGPPTVPDADVDYTFAALGVFDSSVDYSSNCGNMSAAVGPFAVDSGLVPVPPEMVFKVVRGALLTPGDDAETMFTVRIHNTNTGKLINATFPIVPGDADAPSGVEAASHGTFTIDGVPGSAAPVKLDFVRPAGSRTGKLLPTGHLVDQVETPFGLVRATLIDVGNPCCFVSAADLGVEDPTMSAAAIDADENLLSRLEAVRRRSAVMMGLAKSIDDVAGSVPKIGFVSRPTFDAKGAAVVVRAMSVGQPHKAVPVTVALALAAAAKLDGSVVADCVVGSQPSVDGSGSIDVHHASGSLTVGSKFDADGNLEHATEATVAEALRVTTMNNKAVEHDTMHPDNKESCKISHCSVRIINEDYKAARDWILRACLARQGLLEGEAPPNVMASCDRIPASLNLRQLKEIQTDILEQFNLEKSAVQSVVKDIRRVLLAYQSLIRDRDQPAGLNQRTDVVMELAFNLAFLAWILIFIVNY